MFTKALLVVLTMSPFFSFANDTYHYETKGSSLAESFFGSGPREQRSLVLDIGSFKARVEPKVDCGKIDMDIDFTFMHKKLKKQLEAFIDMWKSGQIVGTLATIALAKSYPRVYAYITQNSLRLDEVLGLKFDMCEAIDNELQASADIGKKQLQAEARQECLDQLKNSGKSTAESIDKCNSKTGLPLVDFQNWRNNELTKATQKVLKSFIKFVHKNSSSDEVYKRYASILGEISIKSSGQWEPLFPEKILYPNKMIGFVEKKWSKDCIFLGYLDDDSIPKDPLEAALWSISRKYITPHHKIYFEAFKGKERELACKITGRSLAAEAVEKFAADAKSEMIASFLHPKIPESLKIEYEGRLNSFIDAVTLSLEEEKTPSVPDALKLVITYARLIQEKSELVARKTSSGKISGNSIKKELEECVDESSCE